MPNKQIECVTYTRVSSKDQEKGYSLGAQKKLLEEHAAKKNYKSVKHYEISESASGKQVRKIFNQMLDYVRKNNIQIILCEKVDRLTRNPKDATSISDWINEDEKRQVHFVKENFLLDKNTRAHENLVWDMKVAIARFYTNNLSEEVRKGQKEKLSQGWLPKIAPLGYKTIGDEGKKIHIIDPVTGPFVRKMFELYSSGNYSLKKLVEIMYQEGLRSKSGHQIGKSRMHMYLQDPFYYSQNLWNGVLYQGKQEPLITRELFDRVQAMLSRKTGSPHYKKHNSLFKSIIHCSECGGTVSWYPKKGHWYSKCNNHIPCSRKGGPRQEQVEEQLFPLFSDVAPKNERVLAWLEKALKEDHKGEVAHFTAKRTTLNQEYDKVQHRLEVIYEDKIDGTITPEDYAKRFAKYTEEKETILEQLNKTDNDNTKYYEAGFAIHELACNAKKIYQSKKATTEKKQLLLRYVFSNLTLDGDKIRPNYTLAFQFLREWMPRMNATFELEQSLVNKDRKSSFDQVRSTMLGR